MLDVLGDDNKLSASLFIDFIIEFACLLMLGSITFPHENSRYPDGEMIRYAHGLGIIDALPDICKSLEISINVLDDYLVALKGIDSQYEKSKD